MAYVYQVTPKKKSNFFSRMSFTNKIILVNVIFYFISLLILSIYGEEFYLKNIALTPSLIVSGKSLWTFITSMFSHVQFFHILANMFSLFFIGNFLEKIIGRKRLSWVYILSGILGGIFFVAGGLIFGNDAAGVGASGAIFGTLGVLAVLVPFSKIYLIVGPLVVLLLDVVLSPFIPSNLISLFDVVVNILIIVMLFAAFSFNNKMRKFSIPLELPMWLLPFVAIVPLVIVGLFVELPISNSAHLGGLIFGLIFGFILRIKYKNKTAMISKHFS